MSSAKAQIEVDLRDDRFKQKARGIGQEFANIQRSGVGAMSNVNNASQQAASGMNDYNSAAKTANVSTAQLTTSIVGLGASAAGLYTSLSNINKRQIAIARAQDLLNATTFKQKKEEEALQKALEKSGQQSQEYQQALEKLQITKQKVATATADLAQKQDDLTDTWILLGTSVTTTVSTSLLTITGLLNQMKAGTDLSTVAFLKLRVQSLLMSTTFKTLIFDTAGFSQAMVGATLSVRGLATGVKAFFTALGPIGWAIIGITTAMEVWNSNMFGIQERFAELWSWLKKIIPVLQGLELLVKEIFPEANAEVQDLSNTLQSGTNAINSYSGAISESTQVLSGYDLILGQTVDTTDRLVQSTSSMGSSMSAVPEWYRSATNSVKVYNKAVEDAKKAQDELFERAGKGILDFRNGKKKADGSVDLESLDEVQKTLLANTGLAQIRILLERAKEEAKEGNLGNAIALEKEAQRIGRNTASIAGTPKLASFVAGLGGGRAISMMAGATPNASATQFVSSVFGAKANNNLASELFRGSTSKFSSSYSVIGGFTGGIGVVNLSSVQGTRSNKRRRSRHSAFRGDRRGGDQARYVRDVVQPALANMSSFAQQYYFANLQEYKTPKLGNNAPQYLRDAESLAFSNNQVGNQNLLKEIMMLQRVFAELQELNPRIAADMYNFGNADALLAQTRQEIQGFSSELGLSFGEASSMFKTNQGFVDLNNMTDFTRRQLASQGVV